MSLPKFFALFSLVLFSLIGLIALFKEAADLPLSAIKESPLLEVAIDSEIQPFLPHSISENLFSLNNLSKAHLPESRKIESLFTKGDSTLPFVETIVYKSQVPWLKGRPAWLSDYASYYETSRHFIARSLNGIPHYFKQDIAEGERFNVFRKDKKIASHLVVDTTCCKMWFYCLDLDTKEMTLLTTYSVGLGRLDSTKVSGLLTPLGLYSLGDRIAIYKSNTNGIHQGKKTEMITVFGTRWIPLEKELAACTAPAKGFGIHGTPWKRQGENIADNATSIGHYESDGCIRLATADMEELFAIIITKPTTIEIVHNFKDSTVVNYKP